MSPKQKSINILPINIPVVVPSLRFFYDNTPSLPTGKLPLSDLFMSFDLHLKYLGNPSNYHSIITTIEDCIKTEFGVRESIEAGSSYTGTGIKDRCDIDYLICLPYGKVDSDSRNMLKDVHRCLKYKFGSKAKLDSPAVVVQFGSSFGQHIDVVPMFTFHDPDAYLEVGHFDAAKNFPNIPEMEDQDDHFFLADCGGGWISTSPKHHIQSIERMDTKQRGKLRSLIRLLKAWKYGNNVPIVSYFLESFVLHIAREEQFSSNLHLDLFKILCCLNYHCKQQFVAIVDPNQIADWGRIVPCEKNQFSSVKLAVEYAAFNATLAMDAEWQGYSNVAISHWKNVFGTVSLPPSTA